MSLSIDTMRGCFMLLAEGMGCGHFKKLGANQELIDFVTGPNSFQGTDAEKVKRILEILMYGELRLVKGTRS